MKLFLALAFVAVAAAVPDPIRLPQPVQPQVAEQKAEVDAVRVVDAPLPEVAPLAEAPQAEEIQVDAVKFVDAPQPEATPLAEEVVPQAEEVLVDAVKFVDAPLPEVAPLDEAPQAEQIKAEVAPLAEDVASQAEEVLVDAVKFVDAPLPEDAAETDTIKIVHVPLVAEAFIQPEVAEPKDIPAPVAEEIQVDPVRFVEAPLEEVAPQAEEIQVDAVRFVDAPVQDDVKISREPVFVIHAPVELPSPVMPVVHEEIQYGVRFVDAPQDVPIVAPVFLAPINPFIDASPMIVPQQIMDLIMAEQAQFDASGQEQPRPVVFVDPMLR